MDLHFAGGSKGDGGLRADLSDSEHMKRRTSSDVSGCAVERHLVGDDVVPRFPPHNFFPMVMTALSSADIERDTRVCSAWMTAAETTMASIPCRIRRVGALAI